MNKTTAVEVPPNRGMTFMSKANGNEENGIFDWRVIASL